MVGFSLVLVLAIFIFISIILMSSRFFYFTELKSMTQKITRLHGFDIEELDYSFEQIVYFVSLPSNLPAIKHAQLENIVIKRSFESLFFPRLLGIKIVIHTDTENLTLAYLPIKDFRLPALDQLLEQGKIDEVDYLKISTCKLIHSQTLKEISDEVYKQMQLGRNGK
ncbi:hypothetical protein ACP8HI_23615 [Paenibacillus sp. FA6]|uniref:hypothetical protein n=1 Tax=Paenibacillus sp. FA6 TaxID=3413029 RepID=UPI003F65EF75